MSLEAAIRDEVRAAVREVLEPYLPKLAHPDKRLYTYGEAAVVLGVSDRFVAGLVARNVLHVVPEMGSRRLLRRADVEAFADGRVTSAPSSGGVGADVTQLRGTAS